MQQKRSWYCVVALRYALYVLWLFTLCWWIVALVIAVYRGKIRILFLSAPSSWCHTDENFHWEQVGHCGEWVTWPRIILMTMDLHPQVRLNMRYFGERQRELPLSSLKRIIWVSYKSGLIFTCFGCCDETILTELTAMAKLLKQSLMGK